VVAQPVARQVLLITGSRALCDSPAAESWAREILYETIRVLPPDAVVVAGDAGGPDHWGLHEAEIRDLYWTRFQLDGTRHDWRGLRKLRCVEWCSIDAVPERGSPRWRRWPLERNRVMVAQIAAVRAPIERSALALLAPWASTHGTAHTAMLLDQRGIVVRRETCPVGHAPFSH